MNEMQELQELMTFILRHDGANGWNAWRAQNDLLSINLVGADLSGLDLRGVNFRGAILSESSFRGSDLRDAECFAARFTKCDFYKAKLGQAGLKQANFRDAILVEADLTGATLEGAQMVLSDLTGAVLCDANLQFVIMSGSVLRSADLTGASLCGASLVGADLQDAVLSRNEVWGTSTWDIKGTPRIEEDLLVTLPMEGTMPPVHVDDFAMAQVLYLLVREDSRGKLFDSMAATGVLIIGRFADGGLETLYTVRDWLRQRKYVPIIFDFERPAIQTYTSMIQGLAGVVRMVVVELSGPSVPQELTATVPIQKKPFISILKQGLEGWSMSPDMLDYPWVLKPTVRFSNDDELHAGLEERVEAAEQWIADREKRLAEIYASK
ncbi:MAG TPA: pentapeptide repeat-containing protein [Caldilineaceae bacterium]|nr:pentapeptide repeat-containing protein [Caldilineaceae bacterium]